MDNQVNKEDRKQAPEASSATVVHKITVDDFNWKGQLGGGSYGKVFKVQQIKTQKHFAIKIIDKAFIQRNRKQHHVMIEKEMLLMLKHPGIIKLHSSFHDKEKLYFVMEYAEGGDFNQYIKLYKNQITYNDIKFYMAELILIVEYLHNNGIVHRDLKPENLLLTIHRHLKLIDFGTGMIYDQKKVKDEYFRRISEVKKRFQQDLDELIENQEAIQERQSSFVGTTLYFAPELIQSSICCPACNHFFLSIFIADLWAIGCICYKLFFGHPPFQDNNEIALFDKIVKSNFEFAKEIPEEAQDLIKRLLVKEPSKRLGGNSNNYDIDYQAIKDHKFFEGINFDNIWSQEAPSYTPYKQKQQTQSIIDATSPAADQILLKELLLKDTGCKQPFNLNFKVLWESFTRRQLVLMKNMKGQFILYYTNPDKNNKKTTIKIDQLGQCIEIAKDKFCLQDNKKKKYVFKTSKAIEWVEQINSVLQLVKEL